MQLHLSYFDISIILIYLISLFGMGFLKKNNSSDSKEYLLAGRRMTTPIFVMTLVSTWYGGILGVGEFTYMYGISNWVVFGLPYYIFALLFAFFLAGKIQKKNIVSIPELISEKFGIQSGRISAFFVFLLVSPAPYLLIAGILLSLILPGNALFWSISFYIISAAYLYKNGFKTVIYTDVYQFLLMFAGFGILLVFLLITFPPSQALISELPETHLNPTGGLPLGYIISWFFIALWTIVDPGFHQRCSAASNPKVAQNGILISVAFWFVFDMLTLSIGLYARVLLSDLDTPLLAYPILAAKILPVGLIGLFMTGLLATVMSTLDSYIFISAQTIGYDLISQSKITKNNTRYVKIAYVITGVISIVFLILIPSVIDLWYTIGTLIIPALFVPVILSFSSYEFRRHDFAFLSLGGFSLSLFWYILRLVSENPTILSIEAFYPGFIFSLLYGGITYYKAKQQTYANK